MNSDEKKSEQYSMLITLLKNFSNSYLAFSLAEGLTHPLFVIRNNYLSNTKLNMITHTKQLYVNSGLKGFYASAPRIFLRQGLSISFKYAGYTACQQYYDNSNFFYNILNGLVICNMSAVIEHPIDVWAFNKSIGTKTNYRHLFHGFFANIPKQSVGACVLPLYQVTHKYLEPYLDNKTNIFVSSALISTFLTTLNYPFDYFRMHKIMHQEYDFKNNIKNAYVGSSMSYLRNGIHLFVFMFIIDSMSRINK
jgi:hypothetical protein